MGDERNKDEKRPRNQGRDHTDAYRQKPIKRVRLPTPPGSGRVCAVSNSGASAGASGRV